MVNLVAHNNVVNLCHFREVNFIHYGGGGRGGFGPRL